MKSFALDKDLLRSLLALADTIEAKDPFTGGHIWRVSQYAKLLAEKINLPNNDIFLSLLGGLVHDIGKIGIPDAILRKSGPLTEDEFEVMRQHPLVGRNIIQNHPLSPLVIDSVLSHHERIDGRGYPQGLSGEETSTLVKILSLVDAFDAMTSPRPYRMGMSPEKACEIIMAECDQQFAANAANLFAGMISTGELEHILRHSAEARELMNCEKCGPVITVPLNAQNGDRAVCPACTGVYRLHTEGDSFEVEFLDEEDPQYIHQPDLEALDQLVLKFPTSITLPD